MMFNCKRKDMICKDCHYEQCSVCNMGLSHKCSKCGSTNVTSIPIILDWTDYEGKYHELVKLIRETKLQYEESDKTFSSGVNLEAVYKLWKVISMPSDPHQIFYKEKDWGKLEWKYPGVGSKITLGPDNTKDEVDD